MCPSSSSVSSTSTGSSSGSKVYTLLLADPQNCKPSFLYAGGTNCNIQCQGIAYIEMIDNSLISRGYASQEEVDQIFIPKSKLGILCTEFCVEVEHCLIFLYYCNVFLCTDSLTVTKELTETTSVGGRVLFVKSFEHLFRAR